tara:strand:+ start:147 stop:527 length:381 start_codon:yes stop_codon:yes gene_type:complete
MKTLIGTIILVLFLYSCSDNKSKITKMLESCADNIVYENFHKAFKKSPVGLYRPAETEIKKIIDKDLKTKLNKYDDVSFEHKNDFGWKIFSLRYERYFNLCERDQKQFPIKFEEKYLNHKINYSWN